jgi:hypothetical protein
MNKKANELLNTTKRNTFARYVYLQNKIDMHIAEIALMSEKGEGFKNPTVQDMLDKLADARKRVEWKK